MTSLVTGIVLCGLFGAGVVVGIHLERAKIPTGPTTKSPARSFNRLAAVHEAGHALCAWHHSQISVISRITIDHQHTRPGQDGHVAYTRLGGDLNHKALWDDIVTALGGIAAEVREFRKFRSGPAEADLTSARLTAMKLVSMGWTTPPWSEPKIPDDFNLSKLFRGMRPDSDVARILDFAYARAKYLLEKDETRLQRLIGELMEKGTLGATDVFRVLGPSWPLFS